MLVLLSSSIIVNAYASMTIPGNLVLIEWEVVPEQTAERVAPTRSFRAHLWRSLDALLIAWKKMCSGIVCATVLWEWKFRLQNKSTELRIIECAIIHSYLSFHVRVSKKKSRFNYIYYTQYARLPTEWLFIEFTSQSEIYQNRLRSCTPSLLCPFSPM